MGEQARSTDVWQKLPPGLVSRWRRWLEQAIAEIIEAIPREVPEYQRPLDPSYAVVISKAVRLAVEGFVARVANPDASFEGIVAEFRAIGAGEAREGRSLESLQRALRVGARVARGWLWEAADQPGLDLRVLGLIVDDILVYLDELAAACATGYEQARAKAAEERERRRRRLLDLIVADPPASMEAIAERAEIAGWALPARVALAAVEESPVLDTTVTPLLPADVLFDWSRSEPCLLVPDPEGPGRAALIAKALDDCPAALGPAVPLARARDSLRWARQALALGQRGVIEPRRGMIRCDEHMPTLLIFSDEELVRALRAARLAPLDELRPAQRDRLAQTLLAWLEHGGNAQEAAVIMGVHPQTVRYRLRQIDGLFDGLLRDPGKRFELELALRAEVLLTADRPAGHAPQP